MRSGLIGKLRIWKKKMYNHQKKKDLVDYKVYKNYNLTKILGYLLSFSFFK